MLNIVIPMAGRGSRFAEAGYKLPKPLINIHCHAMIEYVIKNISPTTDHRFIFICQEEHIRKYNIDKKLKSFSPECVIIPIDYVTEGAACTVLLARDYINNEDGLMIANSDQYVNIDINNYLDRLDDADGLIMTMPSNHPKWSYIKYDSEGMVTLVREKEVVSNEATVGIYNYAHGKEFVHYAEVMIEKGIRVNGEYYVAPVYNEMIEAGAKITFHNIGEEMYGLGTPEDLDIFIKTDISKKVFD